MTNKKIAGRNMLKKTRRRDMWRRIEIGTAESVPEVGRCNKKSRTLTGTGVVPAFPNHEMVALTSRGENAPPPLNFPYPTKSCLPQAKLTAKNFQPPALDAWSPNTRDTHVEETFPIHFPEVVEDSSMDLVIGFIDEEEMFNMPGLVNSMAEGMLLTPPAMKRGFKWSHDIEQDQVDDSNYINLWAE